MCEGASDAWSFVAFAGIMALVVVAYASMVLLRRPKTVLVRTAHAALLIGGVLGVVGASAMLAQMFRHLADC